MQERKLTIYFTSDLHSYIYPTDYCSQKEQDLGLFKCASQFQKDGNTLIIDGGDLLQGSPFGAFCHDTVGSAAQFAQIMNRCGYDYVTLGNHDFNYGMPYLDSYLNALRARCVCENVRWDEGDVRFPARVHMLENGLRVGIVGIVTDYVNIWERPEHLSGIRIEDPIPAAAAALAALKGKVDLTVCVYHGGFERDLASGRPAAMSFGTCSSVATIPTNMEVAEETGISTDVSNIVIPLGATMHMDGSAMSAIIKVAFLFGMFGQDFTTGRAILAIIVAVFSSVAMSGIPGGGGTGELVLCSIFFPDHLAVAFPIALALGNLVDPPATMVNSAGDYVVSFIVSRYVDGKDWLQKRLSKKTEADTSETR